MDDKKQSAMDALLAAYEAIKTEKPNDRSAPDRAYAVTVTELEKVIAYFKVWALEGGVR